MTERPKVHAWKACVPQQGTAGSNPALSVIPFGNIRLGTTLLTFTQPRQDRKVAAVSELLMSRNLLNLCPGGIKNYDIRSDSYKKTSPDFR